MSSKEVFQKNLQRNKVVIGCGNTRKNAYSEYLKTSLTYDNLKKGFYIALRLAKHDRDVDEGSLERYAHVIKHFDQQLLHHFKEESYAVQDIELGDDEKEDFKARIAKIVAEKQEFENSLLLFNNEISLALRDGLITDIEHKMHHESISVIENQCDEDVAESRQHHDKKRNTDYNASGHGGNGGHRGCIAGGRGRIADGRGCNVLRRGGNFCSWPNT